MSSVSAVLSAYTSEEFKTQTIRPHCQWNNKSKTNHGLLIDRTNIEASRFRHAIALAHGWHRISQEFSGSGQAVDCLVTPSPVLIVVRRGLTRTYDRTTGELLGLYNRREHGALNVSKVTRFLVYLAADTPDGFELIHPQLLQLSMKGVQRGAFLEPNGHLDILDRAVEQFYSGAPKFAFALRLHTSPEVRGQGSSASLVTCLTRPEPFNTQADLDSCFIGEANLKIVMKAYEETKDWQASDRALVAATATDDEPQV